LTSGDKSASLQVYETFQVPGSKFQVSMLEGHAASMAGGCLCGADDRGRGAAPKGVAAGFAEPDRIEVGVMVSSDSRRKVGGGDMLGAVPKATGLRDTWREVACQPTISIVG